MAMNSLTSFAPVPAILEFSLDFSNPFRNLGIGHFPKTIHPGLSSSQIHFHNVEGYAHSILFLINI